MPKKIIEKIKEAEETSLQIRKNADATVKAIIDEALKTADAICKEATVEAKMCYEKSLSAAKKTAEARITENRRISYENAASMTEIAKGKTDEAVRFIIDSVLEG